MKIKLNKKITLSSILFFVSITSIVSGVLFSLKNENKSLLNFNQEKINEYCLETKNINEPISKYEQNKIISDDIIKNFNNNEIKLKKFFNANFLAEYIANFIWVDANFAVLPDKIQFPSRSINANCYNQQINVVYEVIDDNKIKIKNLPINKFDEKFLNLKDNNIYSSPLFPGNFDPNNFDDPLDLNPLQTYKSLKEKSSIENSKTFKIDNFINNFIKPALFDISPFQMIGSRYDTFGGFSLAGLDGIIHWSSGSIDVHPKSNSSITVVKNLLDSNGNLTDKIDPFFNQIFYHFTKDEVIRWFNFAFSIIENSDIERLKLGSKGDGSQPWDPSYITNPIKAKEFPTFINWNQNISTLLECEKVNDLIMDLENWYTDIPAGSGFPAFIEKFSTYINKYNFDNYNELKTIYDKYYQKSINNPFEQNLLTNFKNDIDELSTKYNTTTPFKIKLENLFNQLNSNSIINLNGTFNNMLSIIKNNAANVVNNYPGYSLSYNNWNDNWYGLKLLSQLMQGALCSNDIICDIITYPINNQANKLISKDVEIYSSSTNIINNSFLTTTIAAPSDFDVGGEMFKIEFSNFRIKNKVENVFLNIDSTESDSYKFNNLTDLSRKNIEFYWNPNALTFTGFNYENWMYINEDKKKKVNAIGININKYLSEIINLENSNDNQKETWSFINENIKKDIFDVLKGTYHYINGNNLDVILDKPVWLVAENAPGDKNVAFNCKDIYTISNSDIDTMISNNFFNLEDWNNALEIFGISTDQKDKKYPLIRPNQLNGEFFIVASIKNFHKSTNYLQLKENLIKNKQPPIVLINQNPVVNNDGYFLIKLKTVHDKNINFNVQNQRIYNVNNAIDPNNVLTIADSLNTLYNTIAQSDKADNNKYIVNNITETTNSTFFNTESWKNNNYSWNYRKLWNDIFNENSNILPDEIIRNNAIDYFRKQIEPKLYDFIKNKYGDNSNELKTYDNNATDQKNYDHFWSGINGEYKINSIPYFFSGVYWNNMELFKSYFMLLQALNDPTLTEIEKQELQNQLNQNKFKIFLDKNEVNESKELTSNQIIEMFANGFFTQEGIFVPKYTENSVHNNEYNEFKAKLKKQFSVFFDNWNKNKPNGGVIEIDQKPYTFDEWKLYIKNELKAVSLYTIYKNEYEQIFLDNYNFYLTDVVNYVKLNVGNEVNNNLVFSTMNELLEDPLVKFLFEEYKIDINKAFIKKPYEVNGSIVNNEFVYEINYEYNWPFSIMRKNINSVNYYIISNNDSDLKINLDIKTLWKLANIKNEKENINKVYDGNNSLFSSIEQPIANLETFNKNLISQQQDKIDYQSLLNIGAIVLVTALPIVSILIILTTIWLVKSKKRRMKF